MRGNANQFYGFKCRVTLVTDQLSLDSYILATGIIFHAARSKSMMRILLAINSTLFRISSIFSMTEAE